MGFWNCFRKKNQSYPAEYFPQFILPIQFCGDCSDHFWISCFRWNSGFCVEFEKYSCHHLSGNFRFCDCVFCLSLSTEKNHTKSDFHPFLHQYHHRNFLGLADSGWADFSNISCGDRFNYLRRFHHQLQTWNVQTEFRLIFLGAYFRLPLPLFFADTFAAAKKELRSSRSAAWFNLEKKFWKYSFLTIENTLYVLHFTAGHRTFAAWKF